jgi:protein-L-isoaspartate(D-aspartate) O-methyltransferase
MARGTRGHLLRASAAGALTLLMGLLGACGEEERGPVEELAQTPVETFLTPSPTPAAVVTLPTLTSVPVEASPTLATPTPTPTFRPTEQAPTPADDEFDRELTDSEEMRARRDELVRRRVMPMVSDQRVIAAMQAVPRHSFVPTSYLDQAYNDHPLPIGYGQTISQPSLVGMMTEMLDLQPGERVLEIGTGSGYQAAILREITDQVYTIEIIPELAGTARRLFDALGYGDIHTLRGDGYYGWWEYAPFDAIIVTAAPDHVPAPLVAQLSPNGGRMVIPVGPPGGYQSLWLIERHGEDVTMQRLFDVLFVPFTRE